jgi:hypothetical protein
MVKQQKQKNMKFLRIFLLMIPSLLLAMTASINDNLYLRVSFQAIILLMQFVIVKSIVDSYEGGEE